MNLQIAIAVLVNPRGPINRRAMRDGWEHGGNVEVMFQFLSVAVKTQRDPRVEFLVFNRRGERNVPDPPGRIIPKEIVGVPSKCGC